MRKRVTELFGIQYPVIQAGMVWCSGWRLASAVSNAGGLGLIGSGSMYPDVLREHIRKCKAATNKPFGVNVPLLYKHTEDNVKVIMEEGVKIVFSSAGNPATYTARFKEQGIIVAHVVANTRFTKKAEEAGVDAIVAEGFEAGGHNGREETTTMCLLPLIRECTQLPLIAAGGIGSGNSMLAAMALGAEGVQIGSLFAASTESSGHALYKEALLKATEGDTILTLKQLQPVRLIKNPFYEEIKKAELDCATVEELKALLGHGRARKGIFEGDTTEGELETGQVCAMIREIKPVNILMQELISGFNEAVAKLTDYRL